MTPVEIERDPAVSVARDGKAEGASWYGGWVGVAVMVVGFAVPMAAAMYTRNVWEDYYITFQHSANLVLGKGLLYNPGERIHGFTSPLGTLLPALCFALTLAKSDMAALWIFRVMSSVAMALATLLFVKFLIGPREEILARGRDEVRRGSMFWRVVVPAIMGTALFLSDMKSVIYSINGMETGFLLMFVVLGAYLLFVRDPRENSVRIGLVLAAMQWTRPDGCIYIAAMLFSLLAFPPVPRRQLVVPIVKMVVVCTLAYLPWFLWAWWYYGSPVPNTVLAKGSFMNKPRDLLDPSQAYTHLMYIWHQGGNMFRPIYNSGPWPDWLWPLTKHLPLLAGFLWLIPTLPRRSRCISLTFLLVCCYFVFPQIMFPWYAPPVAMLAYLALGVTFVALMDLRYFQFKAMATVAACLLVMANGFILLETAKMLRVQQRVIENGLRKQIGLYLFENAKRTDTVFVECLGYIGYYSQCHMMETPGLVTPQAIPYVSQRRPYGYTAMKLEPDWIACRPREEQSLMEQPGFKELYHKVKTYDVTKKLDAYEGKLYGMEFPRFDQKFELYRRNAPAPGK